MNWKRFGEILSQHLPMGTEEEHVKSQSGAPADFLTDHLPVTSGEC
jgi:hypothetical protein